jgi:hypothetical protein
LLGEHGSDLAGQAAADVVLVDGDHVARGAGDLDDRLLVERGRAAKIEHGALDAPVGERSGCLQAAVARDSEADEREIRTRSEGRGAPIGTGAGGTSTVPCAPSGGTSNETVRRLPPPR